MQFVKTPVTTYDDDSLITMPLYKRSAMNI